MESRKDYWNEKAGKKKFTVPLKSGLLEKYLAKDSRILDLGCGYGRILNELKDKGFNNLYGADFSEKMIEVAGCEAPFANLKVNEPCSIPFDNESFDCVILLAVLTCISDNESQKKLINEISRVLKPGGIVYIGDFLLNSDERNLERYERFKEQYGYGVFVLDDGGVLRHHSEEWINELTSGFEKLEFLKTTHTTMNGHISNGFYWLGRKKRD
jgi:SAM-dependent methyltransferase